MSETATGHECDDDCQEPSVIHTYQGLAFPRKKCKHQHLTPLQANDGLGTGPIVADVCICCDSIFRRPGW